MEEHAEIKASPQEPVEGIIVEPEIVDAAPSPEADQAEAETTEEEAPQDPRDVEIANLHGQLTEQLELVNSIKRQHGEAIAEFNSARTRLKREVKREVQNSLKSLIGELLETVDNLDRAIEAAGTKGDEGELLTGVTMVRDQFLNKLGNNDVKRMQALGAPFNPNQHEAISMVPVTEPEQDGTVVAVITEGYTINGEVLRAAMVAVGQCAAPAASPDDADTTEQAPEENQS